MFAFSSCNCNSICRYFNTCCTRSCASLVSRICCFCGNSIFRLDVIKLAKNFIVLILFNTIFASFGIFGDSSMILLAMSFRLSIMAFSCCWSIIGTSVMYSTSASIIGSDETFCFTMKRFTPCRISVLPPSGMDSILIIFAVVPIVYRSPGSGSSIFVSRCAITPMYLFSLYAFLTALMDFSLPTEIGITTPGNKTLFLKGKIGSTFGRWSLLVLSSSSIDSKGTISTSSSIILDNSIF